MVGNALVQQLANRAFPTLACSSQVEKLEQQFRAYGSVEVQDISRLSFQSFPSSIWINCAFPRTSEGAVLAATLPDTLAMISQMQQLGCQLLINLSSQSVYAKKGSQVPNEKTAVQPQSLYGMTKYALEELLMMKCQSLNMSAVNIRLGSLAASHFDQRLINRFLLQIQKGQPLKIDPGANAFSYLYLPDAIGALLTMIEKLATSQPIKALDAIYNLGNEDWMSLAEIAAYSNQLAEIKGLEPSPIIYNEHSSEYNNRINSEKFYQTFHWQPAYSMKALIKEIWDIRLNS